MTDIVCDEVRAAMAEADIARLLLALERVVTAIEKVLQTYAEHCPYVGPQKENHEKCTRL